MILNFEPFLRFSAVLETFLVTLNLLHPLLDQVVNLLDGLLILNCSPCLKSPALVLNRAWIHSFLDLLSRYLPCRPLSQQLS